MDADTDLDGQMVRWRHTLHRFPETGFREHRTADFLAQALALMGLEVHRGLGGTGLVASLRVGDGPGVWACARTWMRWR
jgi:metal-dependent amidase/aminoacylase/carboxypeptidase family protein